MTGGGVAVVPARRDLAPFNTEARYTSADFFPMFDVPFLHGTGWSAAEDDGRARVVVIAKELNERLFGGADSVGRTIRLDEHDFRIVGVLDRWRPTPHFYDLNTGNYAGAEQVFMPFSTAVELQLGRNGSMNCFDNRAEGVRDTDVGAPCVWMQFWVQLDTPQKAKEYEAFLRNYSDQQRAAGRFERPTNVKLRSLMEWLDYQEVVPSDVNLQVWLAFGFLLVCLVNTVGLLLAKFLRRSTEIGVRRALGASRRAIFAQCLVEAGTIGLAGGILGLGLAQLGLWAVRQQPADYAELARLDPLMLATTFVLAIVASLLAGTRPAWRACLVTPAIQLKSQ
jgi:putative ABC transport system permease protein